MKKLIYYYQIDLVVDAKKCKGESMNLLNSLWVEKYRPLELDDVVLPDDYRFELQKGIERKEIGNLLFFGPAGGGKSTVARIICSPKGVIFNIRDNVLEINGSAKETRNINFTSEVIEPFLKTPPAGGDLYKIVFIEEFDQFTDAAFKALRGIIEKYQINYGRFITTCNYISKIPDPIQSRFTLYKFKQISHEFILKYSEDILNKENIQYEKKDIQFIIDNLYPDVRKIVNVLQRCSLSGKLKVDKKIVTTNEKIVTGNIIEIISSIQINENHKIGRLVNSIIEILNSHELEYRKLYYDLFFMKKIPVPAKLIINKYSNSHQNCLIPQMHFMGMIFEIVKTLQAYKKMIEK